MTGKLKITIDDLHRDAVRGLLLDSADDFERDHGESLDADPNPMGFSALLTFATATMLHRRFAPAYTLADVIRFVARVRVALDDPKALGALVIEKTIRMLLEDPALGEAPPFGAPPEDMVAALYAVLFHLVDEAGLDEAGVDSLIAEAAQVVDGCEFDVDALPVPVPPELMERLRRS
ncbi:hypothetical protein [Actinomadura madurae]|uniref:hypothetical protein n=2 Tax=Actinomadura madurae TaxID=1993 RepID=UPI0020D1F86A|nr:hypothetical protein [Actinomadura madurae]MCP9948665.1 hypothetical protein [Actinomadura madurae]MCP9965437.1 hypothetical protein [Actinomadura madurae]MCP9977928.1 hypothetical protein [Actinomadura madurae]MCQ0010571.1 hypothetical protein [Actinomadura madurae]